MASSSLSSLSRSSFRVTGSLGSMMTPWYETGRGQPTLKGVSDVGDDGQGDNLLLSHHLTD